MFQLHYYSGFLSEARNYVLYQIWQAMNYQAYPCLL
jgi:hypothetical protein